MPPGATAWCSAITVSRLRKRAGSVRQTIEAGRIAAQQYLRTEGRLYVRVFPHKSITSIPLETRMGKGKGEPEFWAAVIKPGTVLYEISGVSGRSGPDVLRPLGPQDAGARAVPEATSGRNQCIEHRERYSDFET